MELCAILYTASCAFGKMRSYFIFSKNKVVTYVSIFYKGMELNVGGICFFQKWYF